jgi:hypothetical protein
VIAPEPPDTEHTTAKLVRALRAIPDPGAVPAAMITRAGEGYYHDYLSPLAMPEMALVAELHSLANHPSRNGSKARLELVKLALRVIDGEFDASRAESDAWARSPEGKATLRSLTKMPKPRRPT